MSVPGLSVNVKTEEALFKLYNLHDSGGELTVNGSFITEAHLVALVGGAKRKRAKASFWAAELNELNTGWRVINGTCGGHYFKLGVAGRKSCDEFSIRYDFRTARFDLRNWTVTVRGGHVFDRLSGPAHRLDLSFGARGDAPARGLPHGIIGQSFATAAPRSGKRDRYPSTGHFSTGAMAEGAIEGSAADYEVASAHATEYAFSRFEGAEVEPIGTLVVGEADASASDEGDEDMAA